MKTRPWQLIKELPTLLDVAEPEPQLWRERIASVERNIILPLKAAAIAILLLSFFFTPWVGEEVETIFFLPVQAFTEYFFWVYVAVNIAFAGVLLLMYSLPVPVVKWAVFADSIMDGLLLAVLTLITGGHDSILFWLFVGLVVRNAVSIPPGMAQLIVNLCISMCYLLGALTDAWVLNNLDPETQEILSPAGDSIAEPLLVRLSLLWLLAACCYGVEILLERRRLAEEEAREFAVRQGQLQSAGRLAAEFAHQLKNPLAIINNCAYSLRKTFNSKPPQPVRELEIIQEEVARADQIITKVMGYSRLNEGRVEKLDVIDEVNRAVAETFPAGTSGVTIHRRFDEPFPPLLMQRNHLREILVSLLRNAAEALDGRGNIYLQAGFGRDYAIELVVRDDGPGIAPEHLDRVFESYYTTKARGTGLGLAIVKNNTELYGGKVRLESTLGKGASFILSFPGKTLLKLNQT